MHMSQYVRSASQMLRKYVNFAAWATNGEQLYERTSNEICCPRTNKSETDDLEVFLLKNYIKR